MPLSRTASSLVPMATTYRPNTVRDRISWPTPATATASRIDGDKPSIKGSAIQSTRAPR